MENEKRIPDAEITIRTGKRVWRLTVRYIIHNGHFLAYSRTGKEYVITANGGLLVGHRRYQQGIRTYTWTITNQQTVKRGLNTADQAHRDAAA